MMMMGNDGWMIDDVFLVLSVFSNTNKFNSDLSKWDTSRVTYMDYSKLSFLYCVVYINIQV